MGRFYEKMTGIFSGEKLIQNTVLNLMGLHVFRILISQLIYSIRSMLLYPKLTKDQKILREDGIIFIKNFLPNDEFESLKKEYENAEKFGGTFSEIKDGDSVWSRRKFSSTQLENLSNTKKFLADPRLIDLICSGEARKVPITAAWFDTMSYPEKMIRGKHESAQAELMHMDIFFNSHKVFYLMYDVKEEDGPLVFCPGTHHLSFKRLRYEYKKSIEQVNLGKDSFQADEKNESILGLKNIKAIAPANTLVVMNGRAFHRRGDAKVGTKRSIIFTQFRYNPFSFKTHIHSKKKAN
jgi:hypothetical protein